MDIKRFKPVIGIKNSPHSRTLSITLKGRITLTKAVMDYNGLSGKFFTAYNDPETNEFLILLHDEYVENAKKVTACGGTRYLEIGFLLMSCGYNIGETRSIEFDTAKNMNGIILKLNSLKV